MTAKDQAPAAAAEASATPAPAEAMPATVKIRALRAIRLKNGNVYEPGATVDVDPEEAKEFCGKGFEGTYNFMGSHYRADVRRHNVRRAEYVA